MRVIPILFGSRDRRLFGIYHPAIGRKRMGTVICAPLGKEYQWAHRACRLLAERLSSGGIDVLRFDYFGTGDSAGEGREVSLAGCVTDALTAVSEIKALGEVNEVALIGLRIGAAVGLSASGLCQGVHRLVLWDPAMDGLEYLGGLIGKPDPLPSGVEFAKGFPLPARLQEELGQLSPEHIPAGDQRNLVIVSQDLSRHRKLQEILGGDAQCEFELMPNRLVWMEEGDSGLGTVPVNIIERIVDWVR